MNGSIKTLPACGAIFTWMVPINHILSKSLVCFFCAFILLLTSQGHSFAQTVISNASLSDNYLLDQWTVEDGLPVNSVSNILASSDGYLWLATHDGLVRFDGIEFKLYTSTEYPELKSNRIHFLEEAADGSILIKTQKVNIARLKDGTITNLLDLDISISGHGSGSTFYKDERGDVWVGGDDGLYVYREGSLQKAFPELVNFQVLNILLVTSDEVWFSSMQQSGVYRIKNGVLTNKVSSEPLFQNNNYSLYVFMNEYLIGSSKGLFQLSGEHLDTLYFDHEASIKGFTIQSPSEIYMLDHNKGYFKIENRIAEPLSPLPFEAQLFGLTRRIDGATWRMNQTEMYKNREVILENPDLDISTFETDQEGNIWVGTNNKGLLRLKPKLFKTYSVEQGLPFRSSYTVFQSMDSTIWVGTFGGGIASITNGEVTAGYDIDGEINKGHMQSIAESKDGTLIVSNLRNGLQYMDRETKTAYKPEGLPYFATHVAYSLFFDSKDRLWAGLDPNVSIGLARMSNGEWEQISGKENVPSMLVRNILETPSGELWFATLGNGLFRFDGIQYYQYDMSDGLSGNTIRGLHVTEEEEGPVLWVGYEDMGLDRISLIQGAPDFESLTNYQTNDGLFDNSIHTIIEDDNARFWINTNRGIFRVDRSDLNAFHRGEIETLNSHGYTEQDGLLSREGNGGVYPSGIQAFDGYIWFPSQDGVVSFHPDSIVSNDYVPPVTIQEVQLTDAEAIAPANEIRLNTGERDIEISYASLSFTDPEKNQYRYILEGYDATWRNVGTRRTAYYTNLPSGTYTFRVQGSNNEGVWNTEGASFTVVVAPYFYETPPFYLIVFLFSVIVVLSAVQLRSRYFRKRETILKNEVAVRTKELQEEKVKTESQAKKIMEMDEVKSRFFTNITHELRTPLTLILGPLERLFREGVEPGNNQHKMMFRNSKRLLHLIDQLLDVTKLETKSVPINPEPVLIKPYVRKCASLFIDSIEAKNIGFTFSSSTLTNEVYIDPEKIEKVLGNLLGNALKFTPPNGEISLDLDESDTTFLIKITDSGVGIPEEELPNIFNRFFRASRTTEEGFGIGLSIAKELVELHKGSIEVESKPGEGTSFTISLLKGKAHFDSHIQIPQTTHSEPLSEFSHLVFTGYREEEDAEARKHDSPSLTYDEDKTTILVVDDNADIRSYIGSILLEDYRVIEAKNGAEALDIVEDSPPDVIVADIMMPEMDGTTLNRMLKEHTLGSSIPFVFLTAKTDLESRVSGIREGADSYLTKPFDAIELKAVVMNLLSARTRLKKRLLNELNIPEIIRNGANPGQDPFIQKLNQVLEHEYSNHELSMELLQEKMYLSRSGLYRTVNEKTGMNTLKYITQFRLRKAREMLLLNEGTVSEVAYACGFNSLSYFGKVFKDHFGESPSSFVKNLTNVR